MPLFQDSRRIGKEGSKHSRTQEILRKH
jgi:hypothetical protein